MGKQKISAETLSQQEKPYAKFDAIDQALPSYPDGLLYADYLTFWNYFRLNTWLSLHLPEAHFLWEPTGKNICLPGDKRLYFTLNSGQAKELNIGELIFKKHNMEI